MADTDLSISDQLHAAYFNGPGLQIRAFARWARDYGYDALVGINSTPITLTAPVDTTVLSGLLPPAPAGETTVIQAANIGLADYTFWVNEWMVQNYPTQLSTAYTCDFNEATNTVTITLADASVHTFVITGFNPAAQYLYVAYNYTVPGIPGVPAVPYSAGPPVVAAVAAIPPVAPTMSPTMFLSYAQGSGNASLDTFFVTTTDAGYFMPYIPMIINKNFVSSTYLPALYAQVVQATQKALGTTVKYDDLVTKVKANPNVGQIDYAYMVFAVSLNVLENTCRNYIYQFFLSIMAGETISSSAFATWQAEWAAASASMLAWDAWQAAGGIGIAPTILSYPQSPGASITVASSAGSAMNYNMTISWAGCYETLGTGTLTTDLGSTAKTGEFWFETVSNVAVSSPAFISAAAGFGGGSQTQSHIRLYWQVDSNNWRCLDIYNLVHTNMIYGGKAVITQAADALASATESGFLIPLNEAIYESMSLTTSTQMATACCFIVFNAYTVTTAPWYTAGWFYVLLIVVTIAISVMAGGAGAVGLLGTSIGVGTALGFTGLTAIIVGAAANAISAIILISLVQAGSKAIFGPQIGAIVGAIVGLLALQVGTALMNGLSPSELLNLMTQPMSLIRLTESVGNGYAQVMQLQAQAINASTQTMLTSYNAADAKLNAQYEEVNGTSGGVANLTINPLSLTDFQVPTNPMSMVVTETPQSFFDRTLMTGSDICNLSQAFITDFCKANLASNLPGFADNTSSV
jgi:hypothetical protein